MIKYLSIALLAASMSFLSGCDRDKTQTVPTSPAVTPSPHGPPPPPSNPTVPNTPGGTTTATNAP